LEVVQVGVVPGAPAGQSAELQQPVVGMQMVVLGQFLKVLLQVTPQVPLQVGAPLVGVGQETQPAPQKPGLVSGWQMPLQGCWPPGHTPSHATLGAMHTPSQSLAVLGQVGLQASPSQVTAPPFAGATHGVVHAVVPQVARSVFLAQRLPHGW
jgi:hypothetical protein